MNVSKFLSKVLGIYLLVVSMVLLIKMQQFTGLVLNLINDAPLMFVTGFMSLILGILMVVSHTIWEWDWRVLITLIAWLTLLKGISLLFYPQFIGHLSFLFVQNTTVVYLAGGLDLILGLILCYFGFKH